MELLEKSGDYGCKLPDTLLTAKRAASNAATPELATTKGKRIATLQEPDTNTKLNVGLMKELMVILSKHVLFTESLLNLNHNLRFGSLL